MRTLNTKYRISDKTLTSLGSAIDSIGFDAAFELALDKSTQELNSNDESMIITEYLSWSHNLAAEAAACKDPEAAADYAQAARFYRKLSHHVYWYARKHKLVDFNPAFLQAVE